MTNNPTPQALYGYCPQCGAPGKMRERRPNGNDTCVNGHKYPSYVNGHKYLSKDAVIHAPQPPSGEMDRYRIGIDMGEPGGDKTCGMVCNSQTGDFLEVPVAFAEYIRSLLSLAGWALEARDALQLSSNALCSAKMGEIPVVSLRQKMAKGEADKLLSTFPKLPDDDL